MAKNCTIAASFIRYQYYPYLFGSGAVLLLFPLVFGMGNLDREQSAKVIEYCFTLISLMLFIPLYLPDNDPAISRVIRSKKTPYYQIIWTRLSVIVITCGLLLFLLLLVMKGSGSRFPFYYFLLRGFAGGLFVGGLSAVVFSISQQPVLGLFVPFLYYIANMMGKKTYFGMLDLFSIAQCSWFNCLSLLILGSIFTITSVVIIENKTL